MVNGVNLSLHSNDSLLVFMAELEQKMPYDVVFDEFTSGDSGCTIKLYTRDKGTVAKVINTMRTFDSIASVSVKEVKEVEVKNPDEKPVGEDEVEELSSWTSYLEYTLDCTYYPVESIDPANNSSTTAQ